MSYYIPIAIPSYQRPAILKNQTLAFLKKNRYPTNLITIFVASEEQKKLYSENIDSSLYGEIIVGELGLKEQRRFISQYYREGLMIAQMDDDVKGIKCHLYCFNQMITLAQQLLEKEKAGLFGIMPNDDARRFQEDYTTHLAHILGSFFICINHKGLEVTCEEKEDYERTLLYFKKYGKVIRYRGAGVITDYAKNPGGLQQPGREERMLESSVYLSEKYPELCKSVRKNGKPDIVLDFRGKP